LEGVLNVIWNQGGKNVSNTMDEIAEKIGDASASRLYALTRDRQIYVNAKDYRLAGR